MLHDVIWMVILIIGCILCYWFGHVHCFKHVMKYKFTEFLFYLLAELDEEHQNIIINKIAKINSVSEDDIKKFIKDSENEFTKNN